MKKTKKVLISSIFINIFLKNISLSQNSFLPADYLNDEKYSFPILRYIVICTIIVFIINKIIYLKRKKVLPSQGKRKSNILTIIIALICLTVLFFMPIYKIRLVGGIAGFHEDRYYNIFHMKIFKKNI